MSVQESGNREGEPYPTWMIALSLLGLNLLIYGQVIGFGLIDGWDDYHYFIDRDLLDNWMSASWTERIATPDLGYPSAIPTFLYFLLHQLPEGWATPVAHGLSLGFHLINVALVYLVAKQWLGRTSPAWAVALLWSAHPVLAESVAWVTNLKSLGASTAILGALWFCHQYLETDRRRDLAAIGLLLLLGFAFKPSAIVIVPLVVGLILVVSPERLKEGATIAFTFVGAGLTALYLYFTNQMHRSLIVEKAGYEPDVGGIPEMLERVGGAFYVQMRNIIWPTDLHPMYFSDHVSETAVFIGWIAIISLLAYTLWAWRKVPLAAPGMVIFWLSYAPASGVEFLPRFTADTYTYVPLFGLLLSAAALIEATEFAQKGQRATIIKLATIAAVLAFGLMAFAQTARWANSSTLWKPVLEANPDQYVPYQLVAHIYYAREDYDTAARILHEGVQHYSDPGGDRIMALAHTLEKAGRPEAALHHMIRILRGDFPKPEGAEAHTLYLLVGYEMPLPQAGEGREESLKAAHALLEIEDFPATDARRIGEYFQSQGEESLAESFFRRADDSDSAD